MQDNAILVHKTKDFILIWPFRTLLVYFVQFILFIIEHLSLLYGNVFVLLLGS